MNVHQRLYTSSLTEDETKHKMSIRFKQMIWDMYVPKDHHTYLPKQMPNDIYTFINNEFEPYYQGLSSLKDSPLNTYNTFIKLTFDQCGKGVRSMLEGM